MFHGFDQNERLFTFKDLFLKYLNPQIDQIKVNVKNALKKVKKAEKDQKFYHLVKTFDVEIKKQQNENEMKRNDDKTDYNVMIEHDQEMTLLKYGESRHVKKDIQ